MLEMGLMLHLECVIRLLLGGICGFMIGFERKNRAKEAGIRTHFIVASASALMMIVSKYAALDMGIVGDPTRIAAQIVTGVGFLGAGMIFVHNHAITGLTTAAGIWATSGIGMAIGAGMYVEGVAATLIILAIQTLFRSYGWMKAHKIKLITVKTSYSEDMQQILEQKLLSIGITPENVSIFKTEDGAFTFVISAEVPYNIKEQQILSLFDGECSVESH
ncbi:MAG: MgtC/SapB family protein [Monoglobales bacterium]